MVLNLPDVMFHEAPRVAHDSRMKAFIKPTSLHVFAGGQARNVPVPLNDLFPLIGSLTSSPGQCSAVLGLAISALLWGLGAQP